MLHNIKKTVRHTAVYGFGNIAAKAIGVILLPVYTSHVSLSDYGVLGIVEVTILILSQVFMFGLGQAYMRFYNSDEYGEKREELFFSSFAFLVNIGIVLNIAGNAFLPYIVGNAELIFYFRFALIIIALKLVTTLFLNVLRSGQKAVLYTVANLLKLFTTLVLNIYFVAVIKIGIKGIIYSMLAGEAVMLIVLLPFMLKLLRPVIVLSPLKAAVIFGFPLVFSSLAGMILNMGDRYILKMLVDYREVGLYSLGYKIAGVLNMVLIQAFLLSIRPISYNMYGKDGDKRFYSKVLTYFVFILVWAGLGISVFSKEIVHLFARSADYWPAYRIVPLIIIAYIFSGARSVVNMGLLLKKKTLYIAVLTAAAAFANIGLNFLLIPKYKMFGAAAATIISFVVLFISTHIMAGRYYKIPYENGKLFLMFSAGTALFFGAQFIQTNNFTITVICKLLLVLIFPFVLFVFGFYEKVELDILKSLFKKRMINRKKDRS